MSIRPVRFLKLLPLLLIIACGRSGKEGVETGSGLSCAAREVTIQVVAEGLQHDEGEVRMSLYSSDDGFPNDPGKSLQRGLATVEGNTAVLTFEPVPCGRYAISVFHDEDANGEMRTDLLGRPKEGWGVSNDARGRFGPPSFEDAVIDAEEDSVFVHVDMQY